ncbi:antibiotic biosynthesis monooxygenase [Mesorhizobium sp. INR15]|uniref:antibiotic biosynthesis monooxygenase family protein n=1 Tax=Mesorhizobium sp. INR15 TaxID=2654248 RepID=UPI001896A10C|nr:antibiotic biosynthesis monooxygenase [Mesorhizobium sp. INR15]QPC91940.1 antibiotic biosynthesis monooxygenase [Mesorhizobium sp. INR15]
MQNSEAQSTVFRIDRFVVPASSEAEFLSAVAETNTAFDGMEGCLQRHVLKQDEAAGGESTYITIVEWASSQVIQKAREAAAAKHKAMKLDPQELFSRLNIKAELGYFVPAPGSA